MREFKMAQIYVAMILMTVLIMSQGISAKRGCSAFGHSCFGGHGKRSDSAAMETNADFRRQLGQEETPPHPGYPRSGYSGLLPPGDDIIPVRDGGAYERENGARDAIKLNLRNIVKNWMDNLRRAQQNTEDSYIIDNL